MILEVAALPVQLCAPAHSCTGALRCSKIAQHITTRIFSKWYYLWNDFQTFFEGTQYSKSETLPDGLEISIKNEAGDTLYFQTDTNITFTNGNISRNSIAHLEFDQPETIILSVGGDYEPRVFSFGEAFIGKFFSRIFGAVALASVLSATGIGITIWGIVKLLKKPAISETS